jgi:hypothetical protein
VTDPGSGHHIHVERPQLVGAAVREVVDAVRYPAAASELLAAVPKLEAALDSAFAGSGMPRLSVGVWVPGGGSWIATRTSAPTCRR